MGFNTYAEGRQNNVADNKTGINTKEFYDRNLLNNAREKFIISNFTAKKTSPKYEGNGVIFSYYKHIPAFKDALIEGETPPGSALEKVNIRTTLGVYGAFVPFSDDLDIYGEDGATFKKDVTSNLGGAAGETQELLLIDAILASNTAIGFNTDIAKTLDDAELSLRKAIAGKFTSMVTGSTKYSTAPIDPAYVGFVSIDGAHLLRDVEGWVPVRKYGYSDGLLPNEIGSYEGIRVCESTLIPTETTNMKEQMLILSEEALAEVGIRGKKKIETIIHDLGSAGTKDHLNREGSVGSKFRMAAVTLRPDHIVVAVLQA